MGMFRVALLQLLAVGNDQEANLLKGDEACREAAGLGADVALFPEMWNVRISRSGATPATALQHSRRRRSR